MAAIRVATLNVWGRSGDWAARRGVLRDGFRALGPDLLALQETIFSGGDDLVAEILEPGYHVVHQSDRAEDGYGVSIASRWPVEMLGEVNLHLTPRTAGFPCTTLVVRVEAPAPIGPVIFANHFPSWQPAHEHERELQAVAAARALEDLAARTGAAHVVLAGDLDADPDATSVRFWRGRAALDGVSVCYRDAWEAAGADGPGHTFTPSNPLVADHDWPYRRIDYILVRCGDHGGPTLAISDCRLTFDRPADGIWASDHFGVMADLQLPPQAPVDD
jgi:endonuclease/exonuclease/phosphatase family metal-dependent hydrolase